MIKNYWREVYKIRGLCGACLLPTDRKNKYYCTRCHRIMYLRRRIPIVKDWIAHYKQLLVNLEEEYNKLVKERKNAKSSG